MVFGGIHMLKSDIKLLLAKSGIGRDILVVGAQGLNRF